MKQSSPSQNGIHNYLKSQSLFRSNPKRQRPLNFFQALHINTTRGQQIQIKIKQDSYLSQRQGFSPIKLEKTLYNPQTNNQNKTNNLSIKSQIQQHRLYNSKNKYFDSCRSQALELTQKLSNILELNINIIQVKKMQIHQMVKRHTQIQKDYLRISLLKLIDQCLQEWQINELKMWKLREVDYMGSLLQIETRLNEQKFRIEELTKQLGKTSSWRQPASQLLSRKYQDEVINLSDHCKLQIGYWSYDRQKVFQDNREKIRHLFDNMTQIKQVINQFIALDKKRVNQPIPQQNQTDLDKIRIKISFNQNKSQ